MGKHMRPTWDDLRHVAELLMQFALVVLELKKR
jgi:hypothetical protein